jgi:hypothetical protein
LLALLVAIAVVAANPRVFADEHENHRYVHHEEWKKGKGCETRIGSAVNTSITTRITFERPSGYE